MTSLVQLAKKDNLPSIQNIDNETLQWIEANEPLEFKNSDTTSIASKIDIGKVSQFTPLFSWFPSQDKMDSIHGLRHLMRVTIYAIFLGSHLKAKQLNNLLVAASLHDIRRKDDKGDMCHAKRASDWYAKHKAQILDTYHLEEANGVVVKNLINLHEESYDNLKRAPFYIENKELVDIIKTSDALDRYVQPKMKWWLNDSYLELKPNRELKAFAFNLVINSERKYLEGINSKQAVLLSLKQLQS